MAIKLQLSHNLFGGCPLDSGQVRSSFSTPALSIGPPLPPHAPPLLQIAPQSSMDRQPAEPLNCSRIEEAEEPHPFNLLSEEEPSPSYPGGCVHRASVCLGSPSIMERFRRSSRSKTRPSTFSTFSVVGSSSRESPRFYQRLARWFQRKRGKRISGEAGFPMEKHGKTLHRTKIDEPIAAPTRPARPPLSSSASSASNTSVLALPSRQHLRWDASQESGYGSSFHSSSANSSPGTSIRVRGGNSPFSRARADRFRFIGRAFRAGHGSLSEDIPESEVELETSWFSRSQEDGGFPAAEGRRRGFHSRPQVFACPVNETEGCCPPSQSPSLSGGSHIRRLSEGSSVGSSSVFGESLASLPRSDTHEMVNLTLGDFRIKYSELQFGRLLKGHGPHYRINMGRWHGDVIIHSCSPQDDEDVKTWLEEVRSLANIRQENLVLYMGACVEPPIFAVITSPVKAESLHTVAIVRGKRLAAATKLSVLRQTAEAFSYLHAKGISHGRLSAHNIFLESKVKVSLLDYAPASLNLEYYGPEVVRLLSASSPCRAPLKSPEADVFAFGTLVYQMATDSQPLKDLPAQTRVWLAGQGHLSSLLSSSSELPAIASSSLGRLAARCWCFEPSKRPTFLALSSLLRPARCFSDKKLSTSEPHSLDQLGKASGSGLIS